MTDTVLTIRLEKDIQSLEQGARISFFDDQGSFEGTLVSQSDKDIDLHIQGKPERLTVGHDVHAYGLYEDCPTIHKDELFEINLIATKNLLRRVQALEERCPENTYIVDF